MTKRSAMIGVGAVLLVIGLTGLGLVQTGVFPPAAPVGLSGVKPPGPPPAVGQQSQIPVNPPPQIARAPQLRVAPSARAGKQASSASRSVQKRVQVPQTGTGERRHQGRSYARFTRRPPLRAPSKSASNLAAGSAVRNRRLSGKRGLARLGPGLRRYAPKPSLAARPVIIRFNFYPGRRRGLVVARVHLGDRIRVKVRRIGQVDRRVYFTFSKNLRSRQGAVLELKTMYSFERPVFFRADRGYYVIEVKIYPDNPWDIMPRSFV